MIKSFRRLIMGVAFAMFTGILPSVAAAPGGIRFHDEHADTTRIAYLLDEGVKLRLKSPNAWVNYFANQLIDTPYEASTLEEQPEMLTVNMEQMDCTTFMETVLALAMTANERRGSWRDFVHNLQQIRYRNGIVDGYPSRLHYMSDWIIENSSRGFVKDFTTVVGNSNYAIKSLDYMSQNRDKYPALADEENYNMIRQRENSYRGHKFPYLKKSAVGGAVLREGDIVMLTSNTKGLDISHVGIVTFVNNKPHLIHASSKEKKVVVTSIPLTDYLKKQTSTNGIRVIRLCE